MKRALVFLLLLTITLSLASCEVNWFGDTLDVPWYDIAGPIALISIIAYAILMSKTYICPHCQTEFKAKPYQLSVTVHMNRKRLARCPVCKKMSFCKSHNTFKLFR